MATSKALLKPDSSGQYARQIGWLTGRSGQKKFRLGRDLQKAELAHYKLGLLWQVVVDQHERAAVPVGTYAPPDQTPEKPVWTEEALTVAEAIRKHQHDIRVGPAEHDKGDVAYLTRLDYLRQRYGHLIQIIPADEEAAERGLEVHRGHAEHRSRQARVSARIADIPMPTGVNGSNLYEALDAYGVHAQEHNRKEGGRVEAANARRLKNAIHDMDLGDFGYTYDAWNRLVSVRHAFRTSSGGSLQLGSTLSESRYDGLGRRIVRHVRNAADFDFAYHYYFLGQSIAEVRNGSNLVTKQMVWAGAGPSGGAGGYIDELIEVSINQDTQDPTEQLCERPFYAVHNAQFNVLGLL